MPRKRRPKALPPLAVFLRDELQRRDMTLIELEARSGVPDATLSRIISGEVAEPRGSIVSKIARGLDMHYWELARIMGITDAEPGTPDQEAAQIAALLIADEGLRPFLQTVAGFSPENRAAIMAYMQLLIQAILG